VQPSTGAKAASKHSDTSDACGTSGASDAAGGAATTGATDAAGGGGGVRSASRLVPSDSAAAVA
jgi:hypothetical protein